MRTAIKKSIRDLLVHPGRTILVIISLIIGVWGIGSVAVTYTILHNDLNENFMRTDPAHAEIRLNDSAMFSMDEFRKRSEIETAEFRDLSMQRIEAHKDEWFPLWLFAVEDFRDFKMARIYNEKGRSVPEEGSILVERNGLLISNITTGSTVNIRVGGKVNQVPVSGIVFDPAMPPATQDHFIFAYTDTKTYAALTGEQTGLRIVFRVKDAASKKDIENAVEKIVKDLKASGAAVASVKISGFNEHPHQWQLNTLILMQGVIGLLGFFMGVILVSQLMASILARQIRQIGILKAIGAKRRQVFVIYFMMIVIMGIIAGIIAVPLAVKTGYAFSAFTARMLNFEILTTVIPHQVLAALFFSSIILPLAVSLPSILKGLSLPVHQVLSDYGIPNVNGDVKDKRVRGTVFPLTFALALRNTMRRKKRLVITATAMALGVAVFSTGFNMRQSLWVMLSDARDAMRCDVQVVFKKPMKQAEVLEHFTNLSNVKYSETWNGGRGLVQTNAVSVAGGVGIVALPFDSPLINLKIYEGRWISSSTDEEIVMNRKAREMYPCVAVGGYADILVGGKVMHAKLAGIAEELDVPKIYMDSCVYDSIANPDHLINSIMFVANDNRYESVIALKTQIERIIRNSDLEILYVMSQAERLKIIYDHLDVILMTLVTFAFIILIVSAFGMASSMSISIMERTREIGVLRAIGAAPETVYRLFVSEGMIVSIVSIVTGLLLSWPLSAGASKIFGTLMLGEGAKLGLEFSYAGCAVTIAVTVVFGWLASRIPARNAVKISTNKALAYE